MKCYITNKVSGNKHNQRFILYVSEFFGDMIVSCDTVDCNVRTLRNIKGDIVFPKDLLAKHRSSIELHVGEHYVIYRALKQVCDKAGHIYNLNTKFTPFKELSKDYILTIGVADNNKKLWLEKTMNRTLSPLEYHKQGVVSVLEGDIILATYDSVEYLGNDLFKVGEKKYNKIKYGILDNKKHIILPIKYNKVSKISDDLYYLEDNEKCYLYSISKNKRKKLDLPNIPTSIGALKDGLIGFTYENQNGKHCGYINEKGRIIETFNLSVCTDFISKRAIVADGYKNFKYYNAFLIDENMQIKSKQYRTMRYIGRGLYCVSDGEKTYYVIDKNDNIIIAPSKEITAEINLYGELADSNEEIFESNNPVDKKRLEEFKASMALIPANWGLLDIFLLVTKEFKNNIGSDSKAHFNDFEGERAVVAYPKSKGEGLINKKGMWLIPPMPKRSISLGKNYVSIDGTIYDFDNLFADEFVVKVLDDNNKTVIEKTVSSLDEANKYKTEIDRIINNADKAIEVLNKKIEAAKQIAIEEIKLGSETNFNGILFKMATGSQQDTLSLYRDLNDSEILDQIGQSNSGINM